MSMGGKILGTSRGQQDPEEIVDCLETMSINVLFVIGGDGTLRGTQRIAQVIAERGGKSRWSACPKRTLPATCGRACWRLLPSLGSSGSYFPPSGASGHQLSNSPDAAEVHFCRERR